MTTLKKICMVCMCLMITICMTACVKENDYITITENGGSIKQEIVLEKDIYDQLKDMSTDPNTFPGEGVTETIFTDEDEVEYVRLTKEESYESLEELKNKILSSGSVDDPTDSSDTSESYFSEFDISLNKKKNTFTVTGTIEQIGDIGTTYTSCFVHFIFPGEVLSTSLGQAKENTVKINILQATETGATFEIKARSKAGLDILKYAIFIVPIGIIVVLSIFTVVLVQVNKKRRAKMESNTQGIDIEIPNTNSDYYTTNPTPSEDTPSQDVYVEPESYLDDNGNMYYLDGNGEQYYLDEEGTPYYLDKNGNPIYVYHDEAGNIVYACLDKDGNQVYMDADGNVINIDE